jgi:hypothetical protein
MDVRKFNCKNEELPVIGSFLFGSMKRDILLFGSLSPKYNEEYLFKFEDKISICSALVNPKEETAEMKMITQRMYTSFVQTHNIVNTLAFYLKLAKGSVPVSAADFGITALRNKLARKDAEGVLQNLHIVIGQTQRYQMALEEKGMPKSFIDQMNALHTAIATDNVLQYEIFRKRRELVESNMNTMNDLYAQIQEICEAGKLLFKSKDPIKAQEYTFSELVKQVHVVHHKTQIQLEK